MIKKKTVKKTKVITPADASEYENLMRDHSEKSGYDVLQAADQGGEWASEHNAYVNSRELKKLFFEEDWVFIVTDLVAMKISSQVMRVMGGEVIDGEFNKAPIDGHPLNTLLEQPNPYQGYHAWMYCLITHLILIGNDIEWFAPASGQILTIPSDTVSLKIENGEVKSYFVTEMINEFGLLKSQNVSEFPADEIIHLRRPNPSSLLWGLSPFVPGRKAILFNKYSQDYLNSFYQKGAMPGFALQLEKEANERTALRLLRSFESAYTGRKNMRRTLVLPKGVSVKEMAHTLANQELKEYITQNRETIANLLKIPKHELGMQEGGSLGSEEYKQALKNFWYATLIPLMRIVESDFTKYFKKRGILSENEFLEFDLSNVEVLQDDEIKKAEKAEKYLASGWTVNEVRKKVWQLPELPSADADRPFVIKPIQAGFPLGVSNLSYPDDDNSIQNKENSDQVAAEVSLLGEAGETKDISPTKSKANKDKVAEFLKKDGWFESREKKVRDDMAKAIPEMEKLALEMFADMAATVVKTTRSFLKEKSYEIENEPVEPKSTKSRQDRAKLIGRDEMRRRLRKALGGFEEKWIDGTREILSSRVETGYNSAIDLPFNLPSKNEIAGIRARGKAQRVDALEEREGRAFNYINATTVEKVFNVIERGIDEGKTVQEISEDLRNKFSDIPEIGARAMMIARTEALTAVSLGQAAAMRDAATVVPDLQKMWLAAGDDRVREEHAALHGDVVPYDKAFANGLDFPRDPSGEAGQIIQCRCSFIMVPKDQMGEIDADLIESGVV